MRYRFVFPLVFATTILALATCASTSIPAAGTGQPHQPTNPAQEQTVRVGKQIDMISTIESGEKTSVEVASIHEVGVPLPAGVQVNGATVTALSLTADTNRVEHGESEPVFEYQVIAPVNMTDPTQGTLIVEANKVTFKVGEPTLLPFHQTLAASDDVDLVLLLLVDEQVIDRFPQYYVEFGTHESGKSYSLIRILAAPTFEYEWVKIEATIDVAFQQVQ